MECDSVLNDWSEFSGVSLEEIKHKIANIHVLTNTEWDNIPRKDLKSKVKNFYSGSEYYIYDLLSSNLCQEAVIKKLNNFNPEIIKAIQNHPGKNFLEYGGGIGLVCEIAWRFGKDVTYIDIPGKVSDFAKWRFKKYNIPVNFVLVDPVVPLNLPPREHDIIFTDAVLEHVVNPQQITKELSLCLKENGLFILLVDISGPSDKWHMHREINIKKIHGIVKSSRLINVYGENTFCSIWKKNHRDYTDIKEIFLNFSSKIINKIFK